MPSLTPAAIYAARSDDALHELLAAELNRRLGESVDGDSGTFLRRLQELPIGLRAMASVYQLDVSLALDDLGHHFRNWHDLRLAAETARGLRELGATRHAEAFEAAVRIAEHHWSFFARPTFGDEYLGSAVERELSPLNERLWSLQGYRNQAGRTILSFWPPYARMHPQRIVGDDA
ncbi:MAG: hypothetical protein JNL85_11680 [Rubrivivax sp.]|nr:hypothetical protein [Rubrivivax sp.]